MKTFICTNCGKPFSTSNYAPNSNTKYCNECKDKISRDQTNTCNKKRYQNDSSFRKDMVRRAKEWQIKNPIRRWVSAIIHNHRANGTIVNFTFDELYNLAVKTSICKICGIELDYKSKGKKGHSRNSPSMENIHRKLILTINDIEIICAHCNCAKNTMTMPEFIAYCKTVVDRNV